MLSGVYFGTVDPQQGTSLLIFAFIVVVIGGFGSIGGSAVAAVVVGLVQQYANYYALDGRSATSRVVLLLAASCSSGPGGLVAEGGALRRGVADRASPVVVFALLALVP